MFLRRRFTTCSIAPAVVDVAVGTVINGLVVDQRLNVVDVELHPVDLNRARRRVCTAKLLGSFWGVLARGFFFASPPQFLLGDGDGHCDDGDARFVFVVRVVEVGVVDP